MMLVHVQVKEWRLPKDFVKNAGKMWLRSVFGDGGESLRRLLENDVKDSAIQHIMPLIYLPKKVKNAIATVLSFFGDFVRSTSSIHSTTCLK